MVPATKDWMKVGETRWPGRKRVTLEPAVRTSPAPSELWGRGVSYVGRVGRKEGGGGAGPEDDVVVPGPDVGALLFVRRRLLESS